MYIMQQRHAWKSRKHGRQWCATLKTYARDRLGSKPVDTITREDVLAVLRPIWSNKAETAKRVQGRIENILDFAEARGYRSGVNPARWRGLLDKVLPCRSKVQPVEHHPALPYDELPGFFRELEEHADTSSQALRFLILTACRTSEVLRATWDEIDLERALWTIPAHRMKGKREHQVPLNDAALALLKGLPRVEGEPWVFPGGRAKRPLSGMALLQKMRGMGYGTGGARGPYVPHGFRSTFRDWAGERTHYPRDVCEMALAHAIPNKVEAAYRRGALLEKRAAMMADWARFLHPATAQVIPLAQRRRA
jgi:integrase